ncbi:MAG: alpha/beta fold hydrolase [Hyphomonadaceae bacterium]|nr:alpha/beta fold hydrolase [Hyphomonadaceae bacterium]
MSLGGAALALFLLQAGAPTAASAPAPAVQFEAVEHDFIAHDVTFRSGERMDAVRIHYATLGRPHRNRRGEIDNAVLLLHGTGGTGRQFLQPQFASELFGPGEPLDIARYWIVMPDNIGHGRSSKPSDGLRMRFPRYDYDDMVALQHRLLSEELRVRHAPLILGTSMGCMHAFVWGETYPDFARALMPLACEPVEIAGLNRMWRQAIIDGIQSDPAWMNGEYQSPPTQGLRTAASVLAIAGSAPLYFQAQWPTRDAATAEIRARIERSMASADANDMIYQFESSRTYDPWPGLERITAPVMWINSADDFINPRNFDYPQQALARMGANARFRLIEETAATRGHGTHTWAQFWKRDLEDLLARSGD